VPAGDSPALGPLVVNGQPAEQQVPVTAVYR